MRVGRPLHHVNIHGARGRQAGPEQATQGHTTPHMDRVIRLGRCQRPSGKGKHNVVGLQGVGTKGCVWGGGRGRGGGRGMCFG
jgi:hypothetical protein